MSQSTTSTYLIKGFRWVIYIPLLYAFSISFKVGLLYTQFWVKDLLRDDSGWSTFTSSILWTTFFIPFIIEYAILKWIINLCPLVKIGSAIGLTLMVMSLINYYVIQGNEVFFSIVIADIVLIGTLLATTFTNDVE